MAAAALCDLGGDIWSNILARLDSCALLCLALTCTTARKVIDRYICGKERRRE